MEACIPVELRKIFDVGGFTWAMHQHWNLLKISPSPSYTPDRYIMPWARKDDLISCSMERYSDYLRIVYGKMAGWIKRDNVYEICTRHDRGVISKEVIQCAKLVGVDKDPRRVHPGGECLDVLVSPLPTCDVIISTAILHHSRRSDLGTLFRNFSLSGARAMIFSGPSSSVLEDLIGDHRWHLDIVTLAELARENGYAVSHWEKIGFNEPYCELLVVMEKL